MTKAVRNEINSFTETVVMGQLIEDKFFEDKICNEKELISKVAKRATEVVNGIYQDFLLKQKGAFNVTALEQMRETMNDKTYL